MRSGVAVAEQPSSEPTFKIEPLHDQVLIQVLDAGDVTKGGIIVPDVAQKKPARGIVLAVGPGRPHPQTGALVKTTVEPGDVVLFGKYAGVTFDIDRKPHLALAESDIIAVIRGAAKGVEIV